VSGVDLVAMQLGEGGSPSEQQGHAIEVRLYAEDPAADYQPQSGRLETFEIPADLAFDQFATYGTRLDSGFVSGSEVGTSYDAMLAKLIVWGADRPTAFRALAGVLERARIHGVVTNRDLLVRLLRDERVLAGDVSTDFLDDYDLAGPADDDDIAAVAAALALAERDRRGRRVQQGVPVAWRNVVSQPQRTTLATRSGDEVTVDWYGGRDGYLVEAGVVVAASPTRVVLDVDGLTVGHDIVIAGDMVHVDSGRGSTSYRLVPRFVDPAEQVSAGSLLAPMPGTVIGVRAEDGTSVEAGQALIVLEAMKMQHTINAPAAGVLELAVVVGQQVSAGDVLAVVTVSTGSTTEETDE
jgi:propionyl-CoA carboxylase alpha chain